MENGRAARARDRERLIDRLATVGAFERLAAVDARDRRAERVVEETVASATERVREAIPIAQDGELPERARIGVAVDLGREAEVKMADAARQTDRDEQR